MRGRLLWLGALWLSLVYVGGAAAADLALKAQLVDAEAKAIKKEATVQVTVTGAEMTDPASVNEQPKAGQAHLHYQIDDCPVIATPATKLSFHDLAAGKHVFTVMLAGNDHKPLGPTATLLLTVP